MPGWERDVKFHKGWDSCSCSCGGGVDGSSESGGVDGSGGSSCGGDSDGSIVYRSSEGGLYRSGRCFGAGWGFCGGGGGK